MNPPRIPLSEVAPVAAVRAKLPKIAELLRAQIHQLGELRQLLPLPDERTLQVIYESASRLDSFPALDLALDLETYEESLSHLVCDMEREVALKPTEGQRDDPLR